jgi:MFS family permease
MSARFLRSMAQGALVVDFVLYLKALGWSAAAIGLLLGATGVVGAALLLAAGILSDRFGRRPFLMGYQLASALGALAVVLSPHSWVLVLTAVLLGYGRGANGAAGPFAPVEQAWLAASVSPAARSQTFSLNAALGFLGMGLGTLIGSAVPLFERYLDGPAAYEPLFVLNLVVALVTTWMIARLREPALREARSAGDASARQTGPAYASDDGVPTKGTARDGRGPAQSAGVTRRENVALALLTMVNSVNAVGIGLIGPLLPYWFAVRFGVGPEAIGSVYALTFLLTAVSALVTGEMGARVGVVRSIVGPRTVGVLLLVAMPLMPSYGWAAGIYAVRSILNRGTAGTRQAFSMALVRDARRGLAGSLNALSFRLPSAVGAAVAGWLIGLGFLDLPFFIASAFQFAYVALFSTVLRRYEDGS